MSERWCGILRCGAVGVESTPQLRSSERRWYRYFAIVDTALGTITVATPLWISVANVDAL